MSDRPPDPNSPRAPIDWDTVARHLAGESSHDEAETVRAWLVAHPGDAALVDALDRAIDRVVVAAPADVDVESALRQVAARRDAADVRPLVSRRPVTAALERGAAGRGTRWGTPARRAAAVLAIVVGGAAVWRATRDSTPGSNERGRTAAGRATVLATPVGARDSLRLPDGTRVIVGPASRLTVAAEYGAARRDVTLEGEAYFDVRHDAARPFTVYAGGAAVRDVGTAFVVRGGSSRGPARGARVTVTEGTVELRAAADSTAGAAVLLNAGDVGVLADDGRVAAERGAAEGDPLAWTRGQLVFRDAPLVEVEAALRRWYGLELRVADPSLAARRLTASFAQDPAERVLEVIALALGARVERRGDTAFVRAARGTP